MKNDHQLVIFARVPILGKVKTRLADEVGAQRAFGIYRQLLESAVRRLGMCSCPKVLYVDGPGLDELAAGHGMAVRWQSGASLGERMANAIDECLQDSHAVVLVGVDIPLLDAQYVEGAFEMLKTSDLVLGPTEDGGYCLIALKQAAPSLFEDMPWGGAEVRARTITKAEASGLRVTLLPVLWDVDRADDLHRLEGASGSDGE